MSAPLYNTNACAAPFFPASGQNLTQPVGDALPPGCEALCTVNHRYSIDRVLGQGGFGITYLATCQQDFKPRWREGDVIHEGATICKGSKLAIKECFPRGFACRAGESVAPLPGVSDEELDEKSELFLQEARTLFYLSCRCRSNNLVPIYHCGRLKSCNITFFVMPYVEGGTLGKHAGVLDPFQVADILYQLLQGLGLCHGQDEPILHLDIKPDNIMMKDGGCYTKKFLCFTTQRWQHWVPVLIDFGLARLGGGAAGGLSRSYAPWEQTDSEYFEYVGTWTDVYALGVTMYVAITGERPPSSDNRPPLVGNEDSYRPLHLRPELVQRFQQANPSEGVRLLWSIDVALNPAFENDGQQRGSRSLRPRWRDAGEWLRNAFPYGSWGAPLGPGATPPPSVNQSHSLMGRSIPSLLSSDRKYENTDY